MIMTSFGISCILLLTKTLESRIIKKLPIYIKNPQTPKSVSIILIVCYILKVGLLKKIRADKNIEVIFWNLE